MHHLISIDGDQLRQPGQDKDEFLRNIGSAVVLACLEPRTEVVSIKHPDQKTNEPQGNPIITVRHVAEDHEGLVRMWVWESEDAVAIADLSPAELDVLAKIVEARKRGVGDG